LKLKPSKLNISEEVEFGGTLISSKLVKKEQVVCILPKDKRIEAFFNLKKTRELKHSLTSRNPKIRKTFSRSVAC